MILHIRILFTGLHIPQPVQNVGNKPGYYQDALDHLSGVNKIRILGYFDEPPQFDGNTVVYKTHVSIEHIQNGQTVTGSGSFAANKSEAKEQAAKDAWLQLQEAELSSEMTARQLRQEGRGSIFNHNYPFIHTYTFILLLAGPGSSPSSGTSASATKSTSKKVWKSKLKEYFDEKYKDMTDEVAIKYVSKERPKGGFTSTVYCPDIGYAEGEGSSKSAAEHDAACKALEKLEQES